MAAALSLHHGNAAAITAVNQETYIGMRRWFFKW